MDGCLRYATEEDMDLLYRFVNDGEVRKQAFSSRPIRYEEHRAWYGRLLGRTDARQYIYMYDKEAIGQIRVEIKGDAGEIDYSISRAWRGNGHGRKMLLLLKEQVKTDFPEVKRLYGRVKTENLASQSAFQSAGFEEVFRRYEYSM